MTEAQWKVFCDFRNDFKNQCKKWSSFSQELIPLQKAASKKDTPDYNIENPVVYNTALDELTEDSEIKLIVIGDNPGKNEQLEINRKYLVGQAGKLGDGFFKKNPELQIDFRKNVIILNKTPVHSAKTKHLLYIEKMLQVEQSKAASLIQESQIWMAEHTAMLHSKLVELAEAENTFIPELWLVGYSELKDKGIFTAYRDKLKAVYTNSADITTPAWQKVYVYQHFSMNCFSKDLKTHQTTTPSHSLKQTLESLGQNHKEGIFY